MTNLTNLRTDIHRPAEMDPEHYEYVYADDNERPGRLIGVDMDWYRSITNWPEATRDRGTSQCHHCGARIRYFAILEHIPTGEHIAVGETCLDNRFSLQSKADFDRLRKAAQLDRAKMRIKTAAAEFIEQFDGDFNLALNRETDLVETFGFDRESYAYRTLMSMRDGLWNKYGSLTPRQIPFAERMLAEGRDAAQRAAQVAAERAAEEARKVAAPEGRQELQGVVVSRKGRETDFGYVHKLTIKVETAAGLFLVWVTEPSNITCERGDIVRMKATLKRSDRDEAFAFGTRPSNAEVVGQISSDELDALAD